MRDIQKNIGLENKNTALLSDASIPCPSQCVWAGLGMPIILQLRAIKENRHPCGQRFSFGVASRMLLQRHNLVKINIANWLSIVNHNYLWILLYSR